MTRRQAVLSLWATCLIWGVAFPLTKLALRDASPMAFTSVRFVIASLLVGPALPKISREEWRAGAVLGGLLALGFATQTIGLQWTTASRSGFPHLPVHPVHSAHRAAGLSHAAGASGWTGIGSRRDRYGHPDPPRRPGGGPQSR